MNAAKKIILLLWLVIVASLGNASALTPGAMENRTWEKSWATVETRRAEPLQTLGRHQENEGAGYDYASDSLLTANGGVSLADDLAAAASRARNTVGPGSGGAYGTRVHSAFEAEVNGLGRGLQTEVSYLNGQVVPRGTPGSVRLDVVNGPLNAPTSIFDLKTGSATLTPGRIQQIQSHVPGGSGVPVFEVRP